MSTEFDLTLSCGLHICVVYLPEGAGNMKVHQGEYLWCCETPVKVHGRGYVTSLDEARAACLRSAQIVLAESRTALDGAR